MLLEWWNYKGNKIHSNMTLGDGSSDADKGAFGFVNVGSIIRFTVIYQMLLYKITQYISTQKIQVELQLIHKLLITLISLLLERTTMESIQQVMLLIMEI